jgi:hypothetical protein
LNKRGEMTVKTHSAKLPGEQHLRNKLRTWWNVNLFQLFLTMGKPLVAQKYFNRVPLPENIRDRADFAAKERRIWQRYLDQEGNLRLITWKRTLIFMLKSVALTGLTFGLIITIFDQVVRIKELKAENKALTSRVITGPVAKPHSEPVAEQPPAGTQKMELTTGKAAAVYTRKQPIFTGKRLYLPIFINEEKDYIFYLSQDYFTGESISLDNGRQARKFLLPGNNAIYYCYSLESSEPGGEWLEESEFTAQKALLPRGPQLLPQDNLARQLRSKPDDVSILIQTIPKDKPMEFIKFAPISSISSGYTWMQVKYTEQDGNPVEGWIAAISLTKRYVKPDNQSDTLKVVASKKLSFRTEPNTGASRLPGKTHLFPGDKVKFLKFAAFIEVFSGDYLMIQVEYKDSQANKIYVGWIAAAQINKKLIKTIEEMPTGNLKPTKQENF